MGKLRTLSLIILFAVAASAGNGFLYGQSYAAYPLFIYGEHADIAADYNNNLHVIWLRYGTMYYGRIINNAISGTQTVPGTTNAVAVHWSWPHIAASPSGDAVHVLWVGSNHRYLFHSWRNSSGTWTTETVRTSTYSQFFWPVCAIDAVGNVHAIYGNSPGDGNCDVFYTIKNVAGNWSTPVEISGGDTYLNTNNPDFSEYDMFSDSNGGIHAKWSLINTKYMRYRYCASGGSLASSSTSYMVDNGATSVGPGDLHVEKSGIVHMGFNAYNGSVNMDHSYKPVGGSWTAPTRARSAANTAHEIWPTIAVPRDGSNRVFVAWAEGTSFMKMAVKDGSSWTLYDLDTAAGMDDDWIKPAMTATDSALCGLWRTGATYSNSWMLGVIPTKTVTVLSPNGGESWQAGTTKEITWSDTSLSRDVKIELSRDGGANYSTIVSSTPNDGSYSWDIEKVPSLNCIIRISIVLGTASDTSNAPFVLSSPPSLTGNSFILPVSWTPAGNGTDGWYVGDFNGDGRSDLLRYVPEVSGGQVFLSSGSSFDYNGSWTGAGYGADGWYVGDYNGDGRSDLLRYVPGVSGGQVFLSDGSQFNYAGSWTGAGYGTDGWYVGDFNGDGRSDLLRYVPGVSGGQVFLSNGSSFDYSGSWTGAGNGTDGWYVGDYNGDGRSDLLRYVPGVSGGEVFLSDGTQFIYGGSWTPAGNGGNGWYLGDFNGDNRCDIMRYVLYLSGADMFLAGNANFVYDGSWTPAGKGDEDWYVGDFNGDGRSDLMRYRVGISGGEVLLSTVTATTGSALSTTPMTVQANGDKGSWLGDVPANTPLSAEEVTFVREIKARITAGEEVSIYQIQKEYEKLTGKAHTRARIFKLLKQQQWDLVYKLKQEDLLK